MKVITSVISGVGALLAATAAHAAQPVDWGIWHQPAASDMMASIEWFDAYTFWFITPITIFVMFLLLFVMIRFNSRTNPNPSKTSHNTTIEVIWTVAPIIVLVAIAIPSFELLNDQLRPEEEPTLTVKATGQTWYWDYEYQDESEISFSANMLQEDDREEAGKTDKAMYPRLLAVDNELVVPVNEMVRLLVTADPEGVIHNWAMPAFGNKMDAVPGRINEAWFKANKEGLYYGQCSELCGLNHAFMPIGVRVVSRPQFEEWQANVAAAGLENANRQLVAAIEAENKIRLAQAKSAE